MFILDNSYWEVKETLEKGKGVFAKKEISPGTILGDYIGKFISTTDDEIYEEKYGLYLFSFSRKLSLFPDLNSVGVHLLNNSCAANVSVTTHQYHVIYYVNRKVFPNEELVISYSLSPPSGGIEQTYPCYCGTLVCRGTMNVSKEEDVENEKEYQDNKPDNLDYLPGDTLPPLSSYPSKIDFDPDEDFFGYEGETPHRYNKEKLPDILTAKKLISETGRMIHVTKQNMIIYGIRKDIVYGISEKKILPQKFQ